MTELVWAAWGNNGEFLSGGIDIGGTVFYLLIKLKYDDRTFWPLILSGRPNEIGTEAAYGPALPTVGDAMEWLSKMDIDQLSAYWESNK
jgi:hypothetical protein